LRPNTEGHIKSTNANDSDFTEHFIESAKWLRARFGDAAVSDAGAGAGAGAAYAPSPYMFLEQVPAMTVTSDVL
jgi:hypothetical protein